MLWGIDELISYVSQYFTLKLGILFYRNTCRSSCPVKPDDVLEDFGRT
jgi:2-keto-4-pentenoate hydratase/2-oxohepta-3-ene-1,7-dioic acid hydratase in catechol pathway